MNIFSERLKTALDKRKVKPAELSERTGISKSSISEWISGKYEAKADKIVLIAKALDVNESYLIGLNVPMENNMKDFNKNNNFIDDPIITEMLKLMENLDKNSLENILNFIKFEYDKAEQAKQTEEKNASVS
ncbi:MAG: helix-turn-helix transcriptional regulator [Lactococcus raffinolactis]